MCFAVSKADMKDIRIEQLARKRLWKSRRLGAIERAAGRKYAHLVVVWCDEHCNVRLLQVEPRSHSRRNYERRVHRRNRSAAVGNRCDPTICAMLSIPNPNTTRLTTCIALNMATHTLQTDNVPQNSSYTRGLWCRRLTPSNNPQSKMHAPMSNLSRISAQP